jgi:predicted ATP-dependent endonuclease of OLD family
MRCIRIEYHGFKRLADTSCNTDGKLIAFLGPNEAGKSSVLQGLDWLSHAEEPLLSQLRNRNLKASEAQGAIVRSTFALSDADRQAIAHLPFQGRALRFTVGRWVDGVVRTGVEPRLSRTTEPFDAVRDEIDRRSDLLADDTTTEVKTGLELARRLTDEPDGSWDEDNDASLEALIEWLREPITPASSGVDQSSSDALDDEEDFRLAGMIEQMREVLRAEHPSDTARHILFERVPEFTLFTEADRQLQFSYDLADRNLRDTPPQALANLLGIAALDLHLLWDQVNQGDSGAALTTERRANERLRTKLGPKWRQESIDVEFNVSGTQLQILIIETSENGANTPITERSDGLRMFVALVAFLAWHSFETPPILLIDEAETHLHYDAQADLLEVLTSDVDATQVFYTTHSPGCLPRDLGTGIRLVAPSPGRRDASELRNDFWTNERPGFTPLLFAMGAGAAAFSAFRRAVLTEGAADMILLPSLLRLATGVGDLPYQVAPGLSNYRGSGLELEETAARVVYLVDGDAGGHKHARWLRDVGIDPSRVFTLEKGRATEDYVHPDRYLEVVNALITATPGKSMISLQDLDPAKPISKAVADWCRDHGTRSPGKPAVASVLIGEPDALRLADGAGEALNELHDAMMSAFTSQPRERS